MNTNYQMWITGNAEAEKLRIPVLPEKFTVSIGSKNKSVEVAGLGEITVKQARAAYQFSYNSFFPARRFPGLSVGSPPAPLECVERIKRWMESEKPVHLILTNVGVNAFCTIEKFSYYEQGGDIGTIHYSITLKEYREVTMRKVKVERVVTPTATETVASVDKTPQRVDNTTPPQTYTVKSGDCLWAIAQKYWGDGSRWEELYYANTSVIDPHKGGHQMIWPGDVLTIPA